MSLSRSFEYFLEDVSCPADRTDRSARMSDDHGSGSRRPTGRVPPEKPGRPLNRPLSRYVSRRNELTIKEAAARRGGRDGPAWRAARPARYSRWDQLPRE